MKKYLFYGIMLVATALTFTSCVKDMGNYNYHPINQLSFSNLDTVNGYQVLYADTLKVSPTVNKTMDNSGTGSYTYQWSFLLNQAGQLPQRDSVISTSKNLAVKIINMAPGTYSLQYRVKDNGTGVTFQTRVNITVTTDIFEGYMLLNNVGGQSRLDMLSYNKTSSSFTQYIDVLKKQGSTVPMNGAPYQVYCTLYERPGPAPYGIFLLTSAGCNRVDQETFAYNPTMNIRNMFIGALPANFTPTHIFGESQNNSPLYNIIYLFDNIGNVYNYSSSSAYSFHYVPLNVPNIISPPFKVAPFGVSSGSAGTFYDSDDKMFRTVYSFSSTGMGTIVASLNYPVGYNMIYMDKDYNNNNFAIMQDPATSKMYMIRFTNGQAVTYNQEITGTDITQATHFAVSPTFGYLFYSVGGKVYEYDPFVHTTTLMIDKGASNITYLNFQHFFNRLNSAVNKNYSIWANYLSVASYGTSGTSGTFELYSVPNLNAQISLVNSWTGFGQIVSVSYRER